MNKIKNGKGTIKKNKNRSNGKLLVEKNWDAAELLKKKQMTEKFGANTKYIWNRL